MALPTGTVTFLFTDIEGSTLLWERFPKEMSAALTLHNAILNQAIETSGGHVFKTVGDAFCAAFDSPLGAVKAAVASQRRLHSEVGHGEVAIRVRMAIHTGPAEEVEGDYRGTTLNRVARVLSAAHAEQILITNAASQSIAYDLPADVALRDLGTHRLKDLQNPERISQVLHADLCADFPPLRTLESVAGNLPIQLTTFIGREDEIIEARRRLATTHLLTFTGSGGSGKTRLALQFAAEAADDFADGVWLVELGGISDASLVPQMVASSLGLREVRGQSMSAVLQEYLKPRSLLLVMDNCEHLLGDCARLVDTILRSCPNVRVVATSREPLGVAGERTFQVPSLPLPDLKNLPPLDVLSQFDSIRLFMERAALMSETFTLTEENAASVAKVCVRLDGIPLALELAAARVRSLTVDQIASRLDDRFRLLTSGARTSLPRHQTLRAMIDWSHSLLSESDATLFRRLSVFAGGCTLEAAESVCAGEGLEDWEVLDVLGQLVEKSLVIYEPTDSGGRYRFLESVLQYAAERLREAGEEHFRRAHRDHFTRMAAAAEKGLRSHEQGTWLSRLDSDLDNVRAALEFSRSGGVLDESGIELAGNLWQYWAIRGHNTEGRTWMERAFDSVGGSDSARAKALLGASLLAEFQGAADRAALLAAESLACARRSGDRWLQALSLVIYAWAHRQGEPGLAHDSLKEAVTIARELKDAWLLAEALSTLGVHEMWQSQNELVQERFEEGLKWAYACGDRWLMGELLFNLGMVATLNGDYSGMKSHFTESLAIRRELGDLHGIAASLHSLGSVAVHEGDLAKAREHYADALRIRKDISNKAGMAAAFQAFGSLAVAAGRYERAARLFGVSHAMMKKHKLTLFPLWALDEPDSLRQIEERLGPERFKSEHSKGMSLDVDEAVAYAVQADGER